MAVVLSGIQVEAPARGADLAVLLCESRSSAERAALSLDALSRVPRHMRPENSRTLVIGTHLKAKIFSIAQIQYFPHKVFRPAGNICIQQVRGAHRQAEPVRAMLCNAERVNCNKPASASS